tara:strand:+ start:23 stop:193 length:171 start_codon:yes stop_codon:yes gene_type:complete
MKQRGFMIADKLEFNNELKFIKGMLTNNEEVERYIDYLIMINEKEVEELEKDMEAK